MQHFGARCCGGPDILKLMIGLRGLFQPQGFCDSIIPDLCPSDSFSAPGEMQSCKFMSACTACCFMESTFLPITLDSNWAELNNDALTWFAFYDSRIYKKDNPFRAQGACADCFPEQSISQSPFPLSTKINFIVFGSNWHCFLFFYHLIMMLV